MGIESDHHQLLTTKWSTMSPVCTRIPIHNVITLILTTSQTLSRFKALLILDGLSMAQGSLKLQ